LLFTVGSRSKDVDVLVDALKDISKRFYKDNVIYDNHHYISGFPELCTRPRVAYHSPLKIVKLEDAVGKISKEMIMIYPPGIPVIIPGERFNQETINELLYYKKTDATILSDRDDANEVSVIDEDKAEELVLLEDEDKE